MTTPSADRQAEDDLGPPTLPEGLSLTARGFSTEEEARELGTAVLDCVRILSRRFNLSRLDGITVAHDYHQALASLDRGYESKHTLTPSDGHAIGVAMTPSVLRSDILKSHIVFNAHIVAPIAKPDPDSIQLPLHVIAHECAHVEVTHKFDEAFPGVLLRPAFGDARDSFRTQVILACWDEYAATRLSAGLGEDPAAGYEETLLKHLAEARSVADGFIEAYRVHGNVDQVYAEVYGTYGDLLKFAAYSLGNADGHGVNLVGSRTLAHALSGHWFEPYFKRLHEACRAIASQYGRWTDRAAFEVIGDIADDVVALGGIKHHYLPDGRLYLDIP
jgi:hypothetical protein